MTLFLSILLSTVGIDRIDFSGGYFDFRITPYIALAIFFWAYYLSDFIFTNIGRYWTKLELGYFIILLIASIGILISVMQSSDFVLSRNRYFLLLFNMFTGFGVMQVIRARGDFVNILVGGAKIGIWIFVLFDIFQVLNFYFNFSLPVGGTFINITPLNYGLAIRPSGYSVDMNSGAFMLVVYYFFLNKYAKADFSKTVYLGLCIILLALTLSRSGILAFIIMMLVSFGYSQNKPSAIQILKFTFLFLVIAFAIIFLWASFFDFDQYAILFKERLSFNSDDSGGIHFALIKRGADVFLSNPLIGAGFGASYLQLIDFFDFNYYSNYHSLFITLLAETGLIGFLIITFILFAPFFKKCQTYLYAPLLLSLIVFNIFYQTIASPIFWIILAYAWIHFPPRESGVS